MAGQMKILHSFCMFVVGMFSFLASSCISDKDSRPDSGVNVGDDLPLFQITLNDNTTFCSSELNGKIGVIVFFNTSCPDCVEELPEINHLFLENPDINFLCIARNEDFESISRFWKSHNLSLPFVPAKTYPYNLFATSGIPRIYISYSPDASVRAHFVARFSDNPPPSRQELQQILNSLKDES